MEAEELKKRFEEARSFWHKFDQLEFKCRLPSRLAIYVAGDKSDEHIFEANHRFLCEHVIDWKGMTERQLLPLDGGDQAVPFAKKLFALWAAEHLVEASQMITAIMDRSRERIEREEASLKN